MRTSARAVAADHTSAARGLPRRVSSITAMSWGSAWAIAVSFGRTPGTSRIDATTKPGTPRALVVKCLTASPRRPEAISASTCCAKSPGGPKPSASSTTNGGSWSAGRRTSGPDAAARRASTAPEELPNTEADPPARSMSAAMSSIPRSTAYSVPSPLAPRPRRS
ncbi:hypothetical protein [Streptomyces sp. DH37]|uniref:hypothetical protein n=1 Tax=Streptomyces sp. DH37 TaxID=3040122 RepID=UPI0030148F96